MSFSEPKLQDKERGDLLLVTQRLPAFQHDSMAAVMLDMTYDDYEHDGSDMSGS